ncbi:DUF6507 family protein [Micrococcaceae bacterium Sec5.7]
MAGAWNIDVDAAAATIKATAAQVESVGPALAGMAAALELAASSIPGEAPVVLTALNDVLTLGITTGTNDAVHRSGTIITSTVQAVSFYAQGDLAMAAHAQQSAAAAEAPAAGTARGPVPQ